MENLYNLEAEMSILGAITLDNDIMLELDDVSYNDFYNQDHALIYKTMQELYSEDKPIDLVTIFDANSNISPGVVANLSSSLVSTSQLNYYKEILKEKSTRRKIAKLGNDLLSQSKNADISNIIDDLDESLLHIQQGETTSSYFDIADTLKKTDKKLKEVMENPGTLRGITTGFSQIDKAIGGLQDSKLYYLAARPGMGKTSLALQMGMHASLKGVPTAIFTLEMSKEELTNRMVSQLGKINNKALESGFLSEKQLTNYNRAFDKLSTANLVICDDSSLSATQIRNMCKRIKKERKGLGLVIIDYLTLMSGHGENNRIMVENNSKGLKRLAKELEIPVLCLAQLSRACEARNDKRPILSDLRETGGIEQDADLAAFIYRDDYYNPDTEKKNMAEFIIRKNRGGPLDTIELVWVGSITSFRTIEYRKDQEPPPAKRGWSRPVIDDEECPF